MLNVVEIEKIIAIGNIGSTRIPDPKVSYQNKHLRMPVIAWLRKLE